VSCTCLGRGQATNRTALHHLGVVPAVLNGIVRPAGKELGDLGPFVTKTLLHVVHNTRLLFGPRNLYEPSQLIRVAFADALGNTTREIDGDDRPRGVVRGSKIVKPSRWEQAQQYSGGGERGRGLAQGRRVSCLAMERRRTWGSIVVCHEKSLDVGKFVGKTAALTVDYSSDAPGISPFRFLELALLAALVNPSESEVSDEAG
jgi:hypothetical protein